MAFVSNSFEAVRKIKLEHSGVNIECAVNIEGGFEISKILSISGDVCEENAEVTTNMVNVVGKVGLDIIYLTTDNEVGTLNALCPFSFKVEDSKILPSFKADSLTCISDIRVDGLNNSGLKVNVSLSSQIMLIENKEINFIKEGAEGVCTREDVLKVISFVGQNTISMEEQNEVLVKDKIKKLLLVESKACLKETKPGVNFVSVSGDFISRILYITEDDKFESAYLVTPFKEEVELDGVTRDSFVEGRVRVNRCSQSAQIEEGEKGSKIIVKIPANVTVRAFNENAIMVTSDMYSLDRELEVTTESFESCSVLDTDYFESKIEGSLSLGENAPRVDKLLSFMGTRLVISNHFVKDGELNIEGIAYTSVAYLNDELGIVNSVEVEVPFLISDKCTKSENCIAMVEAILSDVDVSVKKGREIFFDAKVKGQSVFTLQDNGAVITGAKEGSVIKEKDYAVELYFGKTGQNAWDISKELKVNEKTILSQNEDIVFPLVKDENIVVFYQKQVD